MFKEKSILFYVVLYTLFVLFSGVFIGKGMSQHRYFGKHFSKVHHKDMHMKDKFSKKLNLSSDQQEKMTVILDAHKASIKQLKTEMHSEFEVLRNKRVSDIMAILTPEQQVVFKEMQAKYDKKSHKSHHFKSK